MRCKKDHIFILHAQINDSTEYGRNKDEKNDFFFFLHGCNVDRFDPRDRLHDLNAQIGLRIGTDLQILQDLDHVVDDHGRIFRFHRFGVRFGVVQVTDALIAAPRDHVRLDAALDEGVLQVPDSHVLLDVAHHQ